ncbi:MarR family winged helix-turn-helix transcriptional regulator [Halarcobacter anaerophilus]|jgi:DNA-binding MarR family transcriptional regulator|uniref:MarR family transcriptional regulator n=1 Tax=Halarcobacter anaerophilus TaxID=877500 RepID=A0A4Q0Y4R9_9BACT|nr:MarR family transcriptional regulator [Halarcobacter anaerophilus]QDF29589.1 transcriptional regulator, MarR family [Halarcobacter anaerophilus]RXJ64823.1 MarR family transcriptional regulator [Halarcobacter anaerophilus]
MEKKEFKLEESFGYHFNIIFINTKRLMEIRLKSYNLTHLQFSILINLYKNNVTTQKELLKFTYGDETSITRLIDRLEKKGYLQRKKCTDDKRKKKIVLTQSGAALTEKLILCAVKVNKELTENLEEEEAEQLLRLLQKVTLSSNKA